MAKHKMDDIQTAKVRASMLKRHRNMCKRVCRCGIRKAGLPQFDGQK